MDPDDSGPPRTGRGRARPGESWAVYNNAKASVEALIRGKGMLPPSHYTCQCHEPVVLFTAGFYPGVPNRGAQYGCRQRLCGWQQTVVYDVVAKTKWAAKRAGHGPPGVPPPGGGPGGPPGGGPGGPPPPGGGGPKHPGAPKGGGGHKAPGPPPPGGGPGAPPPPGGGGPMHPGAPKGGAPLPAARLQPMPFREDYGRVIWRPMAAMYTAQHWGDEQGGDVVTQRSQMPRVCGHPRCQDAEEWSRLQAGGQLGQQFHRACFMEHVRCQQEMIGILRFRHRVGRWPGRDERPSPQDLRMAAGPIMAAGPAGPPPKAKMPPAKMGAMAAMGHPVPLVPGPGAKAADYRPRRSGLPLAKMSGSAPPMVAADRASRYISEAGLAALRRQRESEEVRAPKRPAGVKRKRRSEAAVAICESEEEEPEDEEAAMPLVGSASGIEAEEDDPDLREVLARSMADQGRPLVGSASGIEAEEDDPDLKEVLARSMADQGRPQSSFTDDDVEENSQVALARVAAMVNRTEGGSSSSSSSSSWEAPVIVVNRTEGGSSSSSSSSSWEASVIVVKDDLSQEG